jgi:hypothetical protein
MTFFGIASVGAVVVCWFASYNQSKETDGGDEDLRIRKAIVHARQDIQLLVYLLALHLLVVAAGIDALLAR